ncbi:lytic murein transglycosylase [Enterobacter asburiae]|uniref:Lytic murein transglycosylase n=1 Tax=Enterobacter asburiae TaxID=61645 RepID=A0A376FJT3_ENTAS|nr:lytic murein transglycosylase [Enterobacter asburiae]
MLTFARSTGATDFTRQMAAVAFASVARDDVENARLMIPQLVQAQQLNKEQTQELRDIVAWRLMGTDVTDEQARWRDDAIMRSNSTSLVERRVRMALGTAIVAGSIPGSRVCQWRPKRKTNGATGRPIC